MREDADLGLSTQARQILEIFFVQQSNVKYVTVMGAVLWNRRQQYLLKGYQGLEAFVIRVPYLRSSREYLNPACQRRQRTLTQGTTSDLSLLGKCQSRRKLKEENK